MWRSAVRADLEARLSTFQESAAQLVPLMDRGARAVCATVEQLQHAVRKLRLRVASAHPPSRPS